MKKINKAVLPVAGFGTRFLPATKAIPKEMLSIIDKPLVQYAVEEAIEIGIEEIIFITSPSKYSIKKHFDKSQKLKDVLPDESGEIQLTDAIKLILDDEEVNACIYKGEKFDCGSKKGFVEATIAISLRDHEIGEEIKNVIKNI